MNSCEKKRSKRQRRKGKMYPFECRLSKNSKEIDKKAFLCDQWKGKRGKQQTGKV